VTSFVVYWVPRTVHEGHGFDKPLHACRCPYIHYHCAPSACWMCRTSQDSVWTNTHARKLLICMLCRHAWWLPMPPLLLSQMLHQTCFLHGCAQTSTHTHSTGSDSVCPLPTSLPHFSLSRFGGRCPNRSIPSDRESPVLGTIPRPRTFGLGHELMMPIVSPHSHPHARTLPQLCLHFSLIAFLLLLCLSHRRRRTAAILPFPRTADKVWSAYGGRST
jgi:hypothetical protein